MKLKQLYLTFKTLFILMNICFTSCNNNEGEESTTLDYIQVRVFSEDVIAPNGNTYLFYVDHYLDCIENMEPITDVVWMPYIRYTYNRENLHMFPVSSYGKKYEGDLLVSEDKGYSVNTIYWNNLSTIYGVPKIGGRYVLLVILKNGTYLRAYKELTISKNSLIEVHFPKSTQPYDKSWVEAEFIVRDY